MTPEQRESLIDWAALTGCYLITLAIGALILFPVEFRAFILGMFQ